MKVKDIVEYACVFMGKEELLASNIFDEEGDAPDENQTKDLNLIIRCVNNITSEIAADYLPILKQKEVTFTDGKINISSIDNKIQEVVNIKTLGGKSLNYKYS